MIAKNCIVKFKLIKALSRIMELAWFLHCYLWRKNNDCLFASKSAECHQDLKDE